MAERATGDPRYGDTFFPERRVDDSLCCREVQKAEGRTVTFRVGLGGFRTVSRIEWDRWVERSHARRTATYESQMEWVTQQAKEMIDG